MHGAKTGRFLSMGASVPVDLGFAALLHVGTFTNPEAFQILSWRFYYARLIGNPQPLSCPWRLEGGAESSNSHLAWVFLGTRPHPEAI